LNARQQSRSLDYGAVVGPATDFSYFVRRLDLEGVQLSFFSQKPGFRLDLGSDRGRGGVLDIDPHPDGQLTRPQLALQLALPGFMKISSALGLAKAPWYLRLLCSFA